MVKLGLTSSGVPFMPKIVDYPRNSLRKAVALAEAVDKLGGEASDQSAADGMGNKVGGTFRSLISSAGKYGLVSYNRGRIKTEPLYQDYKLAYSEQQKQEALRKAFLSATLFRELAQRLNGQPIPTHLEKLLIREYDVPEDFSSRLVQYFTEGAKETGLLNSATGLISTSVVITPGSSSITLNGDPEQAPPSADSSELTADSDVPINFVRYTVRITGPGIDSRISIKDEEDVDIVEVMLKKVRRLIKAKQDTEAKN